MNTKLLTSIVLSLLIGTGIGYSASFSHISTLQSQASSLESEISTLTTYYSNLNTTFNQLNTTYNDLKANYSRLDAVKGFIFDKTINLTVKIEKYSWYDTFKGNVTNIGNVAIPKIYVFIFFYEHDGSLSTYPYHSETVENLYPNETNSFYFDVYKEDYTFKVLAVGNY